MAVMIPASLPPQCPPGERELFLRLRNDPATADWTVLHSLDVACHRSQITGECDFVVIVPRKGVLCIEVKSHLLIRRQAGNWYYGNNPDPEPRGPFKQASEAMHSIRKLLISKRPDFNRIAFWSCVVLPFASGKMLTGEWHAWQLIDKSRFAAASPGQWLLSVIESARTWLASQPSAQWFYPQSQEPYPEQCKAIAEVLRPDFEFFESPKARQERLGEELKHYTHEQTLALDAMAANPRVAFTGPAGTGKTLLAVEAARRSANAGRRTLLLCFNRFLGDWLASQIPKSGPAPQAATLHSLLLQTAGLKPDGGQAEEPGFWKNQLPLVATDKALAALNEENRFDEIIIDEAQDILWDNYIDFLDLLLRGGFSTGRWRLFGDFERQAIYGSGQLSLAAFLASRGNNAPEFSLRTNCRNTPRVASYIKLLGGLNPDYHRVLRPDDGVNPALSFYKDAADQQHRITACVSALLDQKYCLEDIVFLSPRTASAAANLASEPSWRDRLAPFTARTPGRARYSTIHSFKGLEAPIILLTDIDELDTGSAADLFYVGISRALHRLHIFAADSTRADISKLIL